MAFVQNVTPPQNQKQEFTLNSFVGGLNNRSIHIEDNEASELLNMKFLHTTALEKREGYEHVDELVLPLPITHVSMFKPYTDENEIVRATDEEVYIGTVLVQTVIGTIDAVNYQGKLFFCDGDTLYAYGDFTTVTSTYVQIVGSHPGVSATLKVVNPPTDFVPLEEVHVRGVTVYNYTNGTVHYEPCLNELNDAYLNSNLLPEHPRFIVVHKGRLFVSGDKKDDDNVFMTNVSNPFYFAVSLPLQLPPNSDMVRGMIVFDDNVLIGREYDLYRITGETSNPSLGFELFSLRKINSHTGFANNRAIDIAHSYLLFLGSDGVAYSLSTVQMDNRLLSTQILSKQIDLFLTPISIQKSEITNASACFDTENWYLNVGDITLVYSYRHRAWTTYDGVDMHAQLYDNDEIIWGRRDGRLARFSTEYTDNGAPIYAYWQSKLFTMDSATRYKQFREFYIVAHAFDDTDSEMRVTFELDHADMRGTMVIENKLSVWGKSKFGDRFVDRNINASLPFMIGRRARSMRIRFASGYRVSGTVALVSDLDSVSGKLNYVTYYVTETASYHYYLDGVWTNLSSNEIKQPLRVYEINGEYKIKGKR